MKLDRSLQLRMLKTLSEVYPDSLRNLSVIEEVDVPTLTANLWYLTEHRLAETEWHRMLNGPPGPTSARITAAGLDFLADDGGLSAILGVVTVRLHEETIKALLVDQVQKSTSPVTVKTKLIEQIKSLPAEATKALTLEAIKAGLANVPHFIDWLQTTLAS